MTQEALHKKLDQALGAPRGTPVGRSPPSANDSAGVAKTPQKSKAAELACLKEENAALREQVRLLLMVHEMTVG